MSIAADQESRVGVNLISRGLTEAEPTLTLKLNNTPLGEVLGYVADLTQTKYHVDPHAVVFSPKN